MATSKLFSIGDVVWAQFTLCSRKPGIIVKQIGNEVDLRERSHYIHFFGTRELKRVPESLLFHYSQELLEQEEYSSDLDQETLNELKSELAKRNEQKHDLDLESISLFNAVDELSLNDPGNMSDGNSNPSLKVSETFLRGIFSSDLSINNACDASTSSVNESDSLVGSYESDDLNLPVEESSIKNTTIKHHLVKRNNAIERNSEKEIEFTSGQEPDCRQINFKKLSHKKYIARSHREKPESVVTDIPEQCPVPSINDNSSESPPDSTDVDFKEPFSTQSASGYSPSSCLDTVNVDIGLSNANLPEDVGDTILNNACKRNAHAPDFIRPTQKKIGFLGCGEMGSVIIDNLLTSGHFVYVWNRTPEKYEAFLNEGAEAAKFPSDVIQKCDIVFCCLSDADAVQKVFDGKNGVLDGLNKCRNKKTGFVQLTTLDPLKSVTFSKCIHQVGGTYLEAPIMGSKQAGAKQSLLFICAGDLQLFHDCKTCFGSSAMNVYFASLFVGNAAKMKLVLSMIVGGTNKALQETISLLRVKGLPIGPFIEMLQSRSLNSPAIVNRAVALANDENIETVAGIRSQHRDLDLATSFAERVNLPLPIAAAVNQSYVRDIKKAETFDKVNEND